jgi:hypothetical protein
MCLTVVINISGRICDSATIFTVISVESFGFDCRICDNISRNRCMINTDHFFNFAATVCPKLRTDREQKQVLRLHNWFP